MRGSPVLDPVGSIHTLDRLSPNHLMIMMIMMKMMMTIMMTIMITIIIGIHSCTRLSFAQPSGANFMLWVVLMIMTLVTMATMMTMMTMMTMVTIMMTERCNIGV